MPSIVVSVIAVGSAITFREMDQNHVLLVGHRAALAQTQAEGEEEDYKTGWLEDLRNQ